MDRRRMRAVAAAEDGAVSVSTVLVLAAVAALLYAVFGAATGDPDRYGRVPVPTAGAVPVKLPSTPTDISYMEPDQGGSSTLVLPRDLLVIVTPAGSKQPLPLNSRGGSSSSSGGDLTRAVAEVNPPTAGVYEVEVKSKQALGRPSPEVGFGESPLSAAGDRLSNVGDLVTGPYGIAAGVLLVGALVAPTVQRSLKRRD